MDKNGNPVLENGVHKNASVQYEKTAGAETWIEICGESKPKNADNKNLKFSQYTKKNAFGKVESENYEVVNMTPAQYMEQEYVKDMTLSAKLFDLAQLTADDIVFDTKAGGMFKPDFSKKEIQVKLTRINFRIREGFFEEFKQKYGRESYLKGYGINLEIAYGKVSIITVFDNINLDGMEMISEVYKMDIVYLGPIVRVPDYTAKPWAGVTIK